MRISKRNINEYEKTHYFDFFILNMINVLGFHFIQNIFKAFIKLHGFCVIL